MKELPVPKNAAEGKQAVELARIWAIDGAQYVTLETGLWSDPAAWGLMLADFAQHIASAYQQTSALPREEVLTRIREAFEAEFLSPTDIPAGGHNKQ